MAGLSALTADPYVHNFAAKSDSSALGAEERESAS